MSEIAERDYMSEKRCSFQHADGHLCHVMYKNHRRCWACTRLLHDKERCRCYKGLVDRIKELCIICTRPAGGLSLSESIKRFLSRGNWCGRCNQNALYNSRASMPKTFSRDYRMSQQMNEPEEEEDFPEEDEPLEILDKMS